MSKTIRLTRNGLPVLSHLITAWEGKGIQRFNLNLNQPLTLLSSDELEIIIETVDDPQPLGVAVSETVQSKEKSG